MAEFGWAYVVGSMVHGPSGSVQTAVNKKLSGSRNLIYSDQSGSLQLTGSLLVSGSITANQYNVNIVNKTVTNLSASGDTKFGDTTDDTHIFTGSLDLSGAANPLKLYGLQSGSGISGDCYLAINSNNQVVLTASLPAGGAGLIDEYTNPGATRIVTSIDSTGINAEANLTYGNNKLSLTGSLYGSAGVSASLGEFTNFTASVGRFTSEVTIGTDSVVITEDTISGLTTLSSTNLAGRLTTAAQPSVTSVGTLTSLSVTGDLSASALFVSSSNERVGIGTASPEKKLEVLDKSEQLRLTYSKHIPFLEANVHSDLYTSNSGYLILSSSGNRLGIGTATPSRTLDVGGDMRVLGNLEVTGTLSAKVTDFVVSANNIIFGDSATDTLTFNASTASAPNGLNWDSNTWVLDSANNRIGIGVQHPDYTLDVGGNIGVDEFMEMTIRISAFRQIRLI